MFEWIFDHARHQSSRGEWKREKRSKYDDDATPFAYAHKKLSISALKPSAELRELQCNLANPIGVHAANVGNRAKYREPQKRLSELVTPHDEQIWRYPSQKRFRNQEQRQHPGSVVAENIIFYNLLEVEEMVKQKNRTYNQHDYNQKFNHNLPHERVESRPLVPFVAYAPPLHHRARLVIGHVVFFEKKGFDVQN